MSANTSPIFPLSPVIGAASLTGVTAITSRATIAGTTGLIALTATSTNGLRIDAISAKVKVLGAAGCVGIWIYNGVTSFLYDELVFASSSPVYSDAAVSVFKNYSNLVLPPNYQLFISGTAALDVNVFAFGGAY